jgi:hypothetical protein
MSKLRNGHAPGNVREAFHDAIEAYEIWEDGEPEPTVTYEVNYKPQDITISQACGLVWSCTDIIPVLAFNQLRDCGLEIRKQTYAACARAIRGAIKEAKEAGRQLGIEEAAR